MIFYSNVPDGFDCVKNRGPHLQLQFIILKDRKVEFHKIDNKPKSYIFRPNKIDDLEIYSCKESGIEIPPGSVSMFIYGLQYFYSSKKEAQSMFRDKGFTEEYDPLHGGSAVNIIMNEEPMFMNFEIELNNTLYKDHNTKNSYMYKRINFTNDYKGIRSITLTEPLIKIKNNEYFVEVISSVLKEEKEEKEKKEREYNSSIDRELSSLFEEIYAFLELKHTGYLVLSI